MEKICQCCGMPLDNEVLGTNKDGSKNNDYCMYCLENGNFKYQSIEELINVCTPILVNQGFNETEAKMYLKEKLPNLEYWKK